MKKYLIILVALFLATSVYAEKLEDIDGIYYRLNDDYTAVVLGGIGIYGIVGDIVIPSFVKDDDKLYVVRSIEFNAFYGCSGMTSVEIPNSVTEIGESAFKGCSGLTSLVIPNSVTVIREATFYGCSSLTSVEISNSVTEIGASAFYGCSGLTSVEIPNSVTEIGASAFYGCSGLTSVEIPNSVTEIGESAFEGCSGLTSLVIPNSVTVIRGRTFFGCSGLISVEIPNSVTEIEWCAFYGCSSQTSVVIPNTVTEIGFHAFSGCSGLTSVEIPNSVRWIDFGILSYCSSLIEILVEEGNEYFVSENGVLYNSEKTEVIQCPGAKTAYEMPNSVIQIKHYAFEGCSALTSVEIPNSVTEIGDYAFQDCSGLTSVVISNSVTKIGHYAFSGCSDLTSVVIPNSVTDLGVGVFRSCNNLESVVISKGVTLLRYGLFLDCKNLSRIVDMNPIPQKIEPEIHLACFRDVPDNAVIYIPKGSLEAYKSADGWTKFTDFREMGAFDVSLSVSTLELHTGDSATITATIEKDSDMTVGVAEWSSSNTAVATVDDGKVTAVALGRAVIYYTVYDGYGAPHAESFVVTVTEGTAVESVFGDDSELVDIYTLNGVAIARGVYSDCLHALPAGLYIVRQGATTRKIAVK